MPWSRLGALVPALRGVSPDLMGPIAVDQYQDIFPESPAFCLWRIGITCLD
jgi:hypothetical protein